jgi:hypothetical protein
MPVRYRDRTPEARERAKAYGREYYHRRKTDPEYIQVRRDWYQKKVQEDPGFWIGKYSRNPEHYREYARKVRERTPRIICGRPGSVRYEAKLAGYKSGFERSFAANLSSRNIQFKYENTKLPYILERNYNPDYYIVEHDFYIETKGLLDRDSKAKMVAVKKQHPEIDIRFVFMKADKRIPGTQQTHAEWADRNGFPWAEGTAPEEWFE